MTGLVLVLMTRWSLAQVEGQILSIESLPGATVPVDLLGVSGNGSVLAGLAQREGMPFVAVKWTFESGLLQLATGYSGVSSASFDGRVLYGSKDWKPVIWIDDRMQEIELPPGFPGGDVRQGSYDNQTIVGNFTNSDKSYAFRMSNGQVEFLPGIGIFSSTIANGVSGDGQHVSGFVSTGRTSMACVWDGLGNLTIVDVPLGLRSFEHRGFSGDGNSLVGWGSRVVGGGSVPAIGKRLGSSVTLPLPMGSSNGTATSVSHDGSTIFGSGVRPVVWTDGVEYLTDYLRRHAISNLSEWNILTAYGLSADGRTFTGNGIQIATGRHLAFVVTVPPGGLVAPTAIRLLNGTAVTGGLQSLGLSDYSFFSVLCGDFGGLAIEVDGVSPVSQPSFFEFEVKSSASRPGLAQAMLLKDFSQGAFTFAKGTVAQTMNDLVSIHVDDSTRFVGPNREVSARLLWETVNDEDPTLDRWGIHVDSTRWIIR